MTFSIDELLQMIDIEVIEPMNIWLVGHYQRELNTLQKEYNYSDHRLLKYLLIFKIISVKSEIKKLKKELQW